MFPGCQPAHLKTTGGSLGLPDRTGRVSTLVISECHLGAPSRVEGGPAEGLRPARKLDGMFLVAPWRAHVVCRVY